MSSMRGNYICVTNVKGSVCVPMDSRSHFLRRILLVGILIFNVSRAAVSSTRMIWSERVRDSSFTFRYMFSAPLTRYLLCSVPQEFGITRTICVSHHRWRCSISCILSVLYVWSTTMTKISIISRFIGSQLSWYFVNTFFHSTEELSSVMRNR